MAKKTKGQELQEQLSWAFPHIGKDKPEQTEKAFKYCERRFWMQERQSGSV